MEKKLKEISLHSNCPALKTSALATFGGSVVAIGYNKIIDPDDDFRPCPSHNMTTKHAEEMLVDALRDLGYKAQEVEIHTSHYPCLLCVGYLRGFGVEKIKVYSDMAYSNVERYVSHLKDFEVECNITREWSR